MVKPGMASQGRLFAGGLFENSWFRVLVLLCSCTAMFVLGVANISPPGVKYSEESAATNQEAKYLYVAGVLWLDGLNAYDPEVAQQRRADLFKTAYLGFAYPPNVAPLCLLLAAFSWADAALVMTLLNLMSVGLVAVCSVLLVRHTETGILEDRSAGPRWFIPAIIIGNLATIQVVRGGQTTLIILAALMAGWYYARRGKWIVAGVLVGVSAFKPQFTLLPAMWLVLERRWPVLSVAGVTTLLFCCVPALMVGSTGVFGDWLAAVRVYQEVPVNSVGSANFSGLQNLLFAAGIEVPNLLPLGLILTLVLWWYRSSLVIDDVLGILLAFSLLFGVAHTYDLVLLAPLIAAFWRHLRHRKSWGILGIVLLLAMSVPVRLLAPFQSDILLQFRVIVLGGALVWLLAMSVEIATGRCWPVLPSWRLDSRG